MDTVLETLKGVTHVKLVAANVSERAVLALLADLVGKGGQLVQDGHAVKFTVKTEPKADAGKTDP